MKRFVAVVSVSLAIVASSFAAQKEQFSVGELTLDGTKITATAAQINTLATGIPAASIANGAVTAAKIDPAVVTNVLAAGMTLPAVSGSAITNLTAANITTAGTKKAGKVIVASTISTTVFDFVSGICTQAITTP